MGTGPWVVFDEEAVGPKQDDPALDLTYARTKSISTVRKGILNLVKSLSLAAKCCTKSQKYRLQN